MTKRAFAPLAIVVASALGVAACGGDDDDAAAPVDADVVIDALDGNKFDKDEYTATAGDVDVAYVSKSAINHTLLVLDAENKQIGEKLTLASGDTEQATFPLTAGTYELICDVPGHENMKAVLIVS